jgi:hypothetical protein
MDILMPDGGLVTATPEASTPISTARFPNSYGTPGYTMRLKIEPQQVSPHVRRGAPTVISADLADTITGEAGGVRAALAGQPAEVGVKEALGQRRGIVHIRGRPRGARAAHRGLRNEVVVPPGAARC